MFYGWSIIPFVYIQSFLCKVASTAYTWITVVNIFTGNVQLIRSLSDAQIDAIDVSRHFVTYIAVLYSEMVLHNRDSEQQLF